MWKEVNILSHDFSAKHTPSATLKKFLKRERESLIKILGLPLICKFTAHRCVVISVLDTIERVFGTKLYQGRKWQKEWLKNRFKNGKRGLNLAKYGGKGTNVIYVRPTNYVRACGVKIKLRLIKTLFLGGQYSTTLTCWDCEGWRQ